MSDDKVAATYRCLRMLGEHVLSAARHAATGRIGLTVVERGIATPPFGIDDRSIGVIDGRLVITDKSGRRDTGITTLRAAAAFVGITAGAPSSVYAPSTPCDLDAQLQLDVPAFAEVLDWYELVATALTGFIERAGVAESVGVTLWPEHFDVAIRLDEVNYGGLAGDDFSAAPYAYVAPDASLLPQPRAGFWSAPFGAVRSRDEVESVADLVGFFEQGRTEAVALGSSQ